MLIRLNRTNSSLPLTFRGAVCKLTYIKGILAGHGKQYMYYSTTVHGFLARKLHDL